MKTKRNVAGHDWELAGETIVVTIPIAWKRRGGRKVIIAPDGGDAWAPVRPHPDEAMIRALARRIGGSGCWRRTGTDRLGNWPKQVVSPGASSTGCSV